MKSLALERVVPIISANVSWLIFGITGLAPADYSARA
jgi:hypothetical protein